MCVHHTWNCKREAYYRHLPYSANCIERLMYMLHIHKVLCLKTSPIGWLTYLKYFNFFISHFWHRICNHVLQHKTNHWPFWDSVGVSQLDFRVYISDFLSVVELSDRVVVCGSSVGYVCDWTPTHKTKSCCKHLVWISAQWPGEMTVWMRYQRKPTDYVRNVTS